MTSTLRVFLILLSIAVLIFVFRKIRKTDFVIEDSLFWIFFCITLILVSIFPKICYMFSDWFGFESPTNFVFLVTIFCLLGKEFFMSIKVTKLQNKLTNLIQEYTIDSKKNAGSNNISPKS